MSNQTTKTVLRRRFSQTVDGLRKGALGEELDEALRALVVACNTHEKKGSLTLTITVKPTKGQFLEIADEVTLKAPTRDKASTLMFATPEGFLTRNDPAQADLLDGVREVPTGDAPPREVGNAN